MRPLADGSRTISDREYWAMKDRISNLEITLAEIRRLANESND